MKAVYDTCAAAGVDYMELGYKADRKVFAPDKFGAWKFCGEDDIRRIVGDNPSDVKLAVMADAERCDYHADILPKEKSVIDVVRVACYIHQVPLALDMIQDATTRGTRRRSTSWRCRRSRSGSSETRWRRSRRAPWGRCIVVDSFGSFFTGQVRDLTLAFIDALEGTGKEVGIHAHNNQQLAYANTIEAIMLGANRVDATINGIGRGPGNCPLELIIGFLKNPKYQMRPVLKTVQDVFLPLQEEDGVGLPHPLSHHRDAQPASEGGDKDARGFRAG